MMIFPGKREQPISMTDENDNHWVDNGDGTVTWMHDPDGETDIPWDDVDAFHTDVITLHTQDCRATNSADAVLAVAGSPIRLTPSCAGGEFCARHERAVYASSQARAVFARNNWGVTLRKDNAATLVVSRLGLNP